MFQPTTLPWNMSGPSTLGQPTATINTQRHGIKRKNILTPDLALEPPPPEKHFVTEEEMAAEMRRLQIVEHASGLVPQFATYSYYPNFQDRSEEASFAPFAFNTEGQFSGFGTPPLCDTDMKENDFCAEVAKEISADEEALPRLFVSEEVFKIHPEPILPPSLINSLPRHQLALVPYVPPVLSQLDIAKDKDKTAPTDKDEMEVAIA